MFKILFKWLINIGTTLQMRHYGGVVVAAALGWLHWGCRHDRLSYAGRRPQDCRLVSVYSWLHSSTSHRLYIVLHSFQYMWRIPYLLFVYHYWLTSHCVRLGIRKLERTSFSLPLPYIIGVGVKTVNMFKRNTRVWIQPFNHLHSTYSKPLKWTVWEQAHNHIKGSRH